MEIDWTKSMQQTFEFYKVNPKTWLDDETINTIKSCTINRNREDETLGSANFEGDNLEGEFYIRTYLIAIQDGHRIKEPLGTYLVQTKYTSFNGRKEGLTIEAYTPLMELKEKYPTVGYSLLPGDDVLSRAVDLTAENARAPVVRNANVKKSVANKTGFVAEIEESWLSFITGLLLNVDMRLNLDAMGNIMFSPIIDARSMAAVFTYSDDNSSILYPEIKMDYDLYQVPNVVEIVISNETGYYVSRVVNDDPLSPISTIKRGREVVYRMSNPDGLITTDITTALGKHYIEDFAKNTLRNLSMIRRTITYTHGYCPVRVGDCVRLNYERADLVDIKAVVISQNIECVPGCPVTEVAEYTENLWDG